MKKKELLFIIESLELGGAEKSLVTLLRYLDYSAYNVSLILIKKEGVFNKFIPKEVNIIYYDIFKNTSFIKKIISRIIFLLLRKTNTKYNTAHLFWKAFGKNIPNHTKKYDIAIAYSQGFATYFTSKKIKANKKYSWLNIDY
ncbi:MAG TPA: glycosyltransferase, partial [Bacteroidia bacterium]|nr:glycosyltransferase [Bacteroidia bacterium]